MSQSRKTSHWGEVGGVTWLGSEPSPAITHHLRVSLHRGPAPGDEGLDVRRPPVEDTHRRGVSCAVAVVCVCVYRVASVHVFIGMAQLGCDGISRNASQSVPAVV